MNQEIEPYRERLPALVDWLKGDQVRRAVESGQPVINITINEAPRAAPPPPAPPDVATKYAPHMILATWSLIVSVGAVAAAVMLAGALMSIMISVAVCAVAVAAAVRSLRYSKADVQMAKRRESKGRR